MGFVNKVNRKLITYLLGLQIIALATICLLPIVFAFHYNESTQIQGFIICFVLYL